jgi:glycosyltransferase involved in cell wall biosynthesis
MNSGLRATEKIEEMTIKRMRHLVWAPIFARRKVIRTILENKPDLVVWHGTHLSAVYLSQLRSIGKPLIWDIDRDLHGWEIFKPVSFRGMLNPHHNFLWQHVLTAFLPRSLIKAVANSGFVNKIIVPSKPLKISLSSIGIEPNKIAVVPSTVDKDASKPATIEEESQKFTNKIIGNSDDLMVAYFGSPCTLRGVDTAILSMQRILIKRQDVKLVIFSRRNLGYNTADDWHLKAEEEALIELVKRLGLTKNVKVVSGTLDKSTLKQYLTSSFVVVLPFKLILSEPPLTVLEAMSMGKVVITTNLGSLPEIVGEDRGILIDPGDSDALARTILFLADHQKESAQIGKNAQQYAANFPTWEHIAQKFTELLNGINSSK